MPLYEYFCECGYVFDMLVSDSEEEVKCESCGKVARRNEVIRTAPPVIKDSTPYEDLPTVSQKELDKRIGEDAERRWEKIDEDGNRRVELKEKLGTEYLSGSVGQEKEMTKDELELRRRVKEIMISEPQHEGLNIVSAEKGVVDSG